MMGGGIGERGTWCILRTSPGRTLGMADWLKEEGFEVWTPRQVLTRRRPRSKITVEVKVPIAPTFIFARSADLPKLAVLSRAHPFSIFRHGDRIPLVAEIEIGGLQAEEERARRAMEWTRERAQDRARKARRPRAGRAIPRGTSVTPQEGAFAGMTGVVEEGDGKHVMVTFGGHFRVQIATWLLNPDDVEMAPSPETPAARAA